MGNSSTRLAWGEKIEAPSALKDEYNEYLECARSAIST